MKTVASTLLIFVIVFLSSQQSFSLNITAPDKIKVALVEGANEVELAIKGPYEIINAATGEVLDKGDILWQGKFSVSFKGINLKTFKDRLFKADKIDIIPLKSPSIYFGKCLYRGTLQLIKTKQGTLTAVNILDLEDYIKGVLYHEISHRWPPEAIKAQAVTSRTFAIYQAQENYDKDFYLKADVSSQVYRGSYAEKYRTNKAVEETNGEILVYDGKVLPAFFHACCSGKTESASNLWKISSRPLKGIRCDYCKNAPHFSWQREVSLDEIEGKISRALHPIGKIKSIKILSRNSSGRVKNIRVRAQKTINISAKDLRSIIGSRILSSTNFTVNIKNRKAYFKGYGWGHGVGLCQWGSFAMAKKQRGYKEILEYYYPGAEIIKLQ